MQLHVQYAIAALHSGGVIAYPTEAVYGLGCDPDNEHAIEKLLTIKGRAAAKGLILIAAEWSQLAQYVQAITPAQIALITDATAMPTTWLVPAAATTSPLLRGQHDTLAVRVTHHPLATALCQAFGKPLISTSANFAQGEPCKTYVQTQALFADLLDYIVPGQIGSLSRPTMIKDLLTGEVVRH